MEQVNNSVPHKCWYCGLLGKCERIELPHGCDEFEEAYDDPKIIAEMLGMSVTRLRRQTERFLQIIAKQKGYEIAVYEPDEYSGARSFYLYKKKEDK